MLDFFSTRSTAFAAVIESFSFVFLLFATGTKMTKKLKTVDEIVDAAARVATGDGGGCIVGFDKMRIDYDCRDVLGTICLGCFTR